MLITSADSYGDMNLEEVSTVERRPPSVDDLDDMDNLDDSDLLNSEYDYPEDQELDFDNWDRDEGHIYESIEDEIGDADDLDDEE